MRPVRRLLVVATATAATLVVPLAGAASAHVTVSAPGATQGGYTKMVFRMPTERDVPSTALEVAFPEEHPLTSLRVKPKDGWTYEIVREPLAEPIELHGREVTERVSRIVWTTEGEGVGPDEFEEFEVSGGPLPEVDTLQIAALQTYAGGEVVRWIEDGEDAELPAPVLELAAAEDDAHGGASAEPATDPVTDVETSPVAAESDAGATSGVAVAALVVGSLALLAALGSLVLGRRRA